MFHYISLIKYFATEVQYSYKLCVMAEYKREDYRNTSIVITGYIKIYINIQAKKRLYSSVERNLQNQVKLKTTLSPKNT